MLPETEQLLTELDGDWLTIWFNRPDARNALTAETIRELTAVLNAVHEDRSIRGISVRGKGGVFCAGGDIKDFKRIFQGVTPDHNEVAAANRAGGECFRLLASMPQVVVMLIEGAAVAGGLGIACAGDFVAVTGTTQFAITETTLGIPPAQIAPLVVARVGLVTARRLMLSAARFDGNEAGRLGLADFVVDDAEGLVKQEQVLRDAVRRCAPGALAETKALLRATQHLSTAAIIERAGDSFARCMLSDEGREGVAAFIEKREPNWRT